MAKKGKIKKTATTRIKKKVQRKKTQRKKSKKTKELKRKKRFSGISLIRAEENPIITPKPEHNWEAWQTFNPGVILLNGKVHFLYRAIGNDGISRLGYAVSQDGFNIDERLSFPVYEHHLNISEPGILFSSPQFNVYSYFSGGSWGGAEDPRIVRVDEEDTLYMTYTAVDNGLGIALTSIKVNDFLKKNWRWKKPRLISKPGEIHKNWVIFPEKINSQYAILHSINPKISIAYRDSLEFREGEYIESYYDSNSPRKKCWDSWVRGAGAPPLKTDEGWLLLYHAMEENDFGKYKVGAMLLDLNDPTKILYRSPAPILEPEQDYENNGFKRGVVYVSGAVIKNGELLVYYGASDSYIGVAHINLNKFISALIRGERAKLKVKTLKKKKYDY
jgi:predicted GH43/DUF377 family glycosyl hydrolase